MSRLPSLPPSRPLHIRAAASDKKENNNALLGSRFRVQCRCPCRHSIMSASAPGGGLLSFPFLLRARICSLHARVAAFHSEMTTNPVFPRGVYTAFNFRGLLLAFLVQPLFFFRPPLRLLRDGKEDPPLRGSRGESSFPADCHEAPLLITTLAPSLPKIPRSCGFGLCPLPRLRLRKPSMPVGFCAASMSLASAGSVASFLANSDQLPVSPSTTCMPPAMDSFRVPVGPCRRL